MQIVTFNAFGTLLGGSVRQPAAHTAQHQRARVGLVQSVRLLCPHRSSSGIPFAREYAVRHVRVERDGDQKEMEAREGNPLQHLAISCSPRTRAPCVAASSG